MKFPYFLKEETLKTEQFKNAEPNKEEEEDGKIWWYEGFSICSVCSACISCGTFTAYTSPALPSMGADASLEFLQYHQIALIGGLGPFGSLVGSLLSVFSLKFLGSRRTIGLLGLPALLASWITIGLSNQSFQIMIGRFLGGIGVGAIIASAPLYVMNISATLRRGKMGIIPQFLVISGILTTYVLGGFLNWSNLALISTVFTILGESLLVFAPDSPKWLISRGQVETAFTILKRLHGHQNAEILMKDLHDTLKGKWNKSGIKERTFCSAWDIKWVKPMLVCLGIISLQQLTGISSVTFFAASIFNQSSSSNTGNNFSIILASTQLLACFLSTFFIERFGRTFLLKISTMTLTITASILGLYFFFIDSLSSNFSWISLISLIIFVFGFAIGLGPVTWILIVELLPPEIRQIANPIIIAHNWLCVCIVTTSFPWMKESIGFFGIFWLYAGIGFIGLVFVFVFVPETKGKTSEEIQQQFTHKDKLGKQTFNSVSTIVVTV